jgi:enoyl-CoA hydratase/carnithine racemase
MTRKLEEYQDRYENVRMVRDENGILEVTLHTNGDSLRWVLSAHQSVTGAFRDIAGDPDNRVVLVTGAGEEFVGPRANVPEGQMAAQSGNPSGSKDSDMWIRSAVGLQVQKISAILDIPVPVVCAVNGPVCRHMEQALLHDVVIAADTATFEDTAHFAYQDLVPGDGVHVVANMLLGINRARAFMLLGTVIDAQEALRLGLVAEVLPRDRVLDRAREIARSLARHSDATLRMTRILLNMPLRKQMSDLLGPGLAFEGLAALAR